MLIGLGVYILRGYVFRDKNEEGPLRDFDSARPAPLFVSAKSDSGFRREEQTRDGRYGNWQNR
jgi:hypothetical protein